LPIGDLDVHVTFANSLKRSAICCNDWFQDDFLEVFKSFSEGHVTPPFCFVCFYPHFINRSKQDYVLRRGGRERPVVLLGLGVGCESGFE